MTTPATDRYSRYEPLTDTSEFAVGFSLYVGDPEEAKGEIIVKIDGVVLDPADFSLQGNFQFGVDYPVCTDAVLVLPDGVSGVVLEIEGAMPVRRATDFPGGQGIGPNIWNLVHDRLWSMLRELWQRLDRVPMMPYGEAPPTPAEMLAWRDYVISPGAVLSVNGLAGAVVINKAGVGLGNVPNYPMANQAEAEAGVATDRFMSPEQVAQAVAALAPSAIYQPGFMFGLTISNDTSDAANDIGIAAGKCRSGDDDMDMVLASALTKRLDANWVVGNGQGGLDTGSKATSATYHVWLIKRTDGTVVDALFSASATAPTMPADYTYKRRIGSILTDGSGAIRAFRQTGDTFELVGAVSNYSSPAAKPLALTSITVPSGIVVEPLLQVDHTQNTAGGSSVQLRSVNGVSAVARIIGANQGSMVQAAFVSGGFFTDTSAQIYHGVIITSGSVLTSSLATHGWIDTRGRLSA